MPPPPRQGLASLAQAFDELAFGPARTLNLRAHLPTRSQAVTRCESWLREQQAAGAREVLVITGRGERSVDGVSVVRQGVLDLLASLSRRHVVAGYREHTAGSFAIDLQPFAAVHAARATAAPPAAPPPDPRTLAALGEETRDALRTLAVTHMQALGAHSPTRRMVEAEMLAWFERLSAEVLAREPRAVVAPPAPPAAGASRAARRARALRLPGARDVPGHVDREVALRSAIRDALDAIGA